MPITKSAIKKVKVDKKRTAENLVVKGQLKSAIKDARLKPGKESLSRLFSAMDRAVKHNIVNKRHASRIKSRISRIGKTK